MIMFAHYDRADLSSLRAWRLRPDVFDPPAPTIQDQPSEAAE